MKRFLFALALAGLIPVCFGAPSVGYTSYFHNTHTYTNATIAGTNSASRGVFTNSLSAAGLNTSGTTNATLTGKLLADSLTATNGISAGASTFTSYIALGNSTNRLSDDGSQLTYNGSALQTASSNARGVLTHAGTVTLDFSAEATLNKLVLTGNVEFAFSNLATNNTYDLLIANSQATNCSYVLPSVVFMGYYPTNVVALKYARWWLEVDNQTNSIVYATYVEQQ